METWKVISEFPRYEVSDEGNIRQVATKKLMKVHEMSHGYISLNLSLGRGIKRRVLVHRIVAAAFCSGYTAGYEVDHINGDKSDNRAFNLRWVSPSENIRSAYGDRLHMRSRPCLLYKNNVIEDVFTTIGAADTTLGSAFNQRQLKKNGRTKKILEGMHYELRLISHESYLEIQRNLQYGMPKEKAVALALSVEKERGGQDGKKG